jgi:hypothetical protein
MGLFKSDGERAAAGAAKTLLGKMPASEITFGADK